MDSNFAQLCACVVRSMGVLGGTVYRLAFFAFRWAILDSRLKPGVFILGQCLERRWEGGIDGRDVVNLWSSCLSLCSFSDSMPLVMAKYSALSDIVMVEYWARPVRRTANARNIWDRELVGTGFNLERILLMVCWIVSGV